MNTIPSYNLVQVTTQDDIKLSGLYTPGDTTKSAAIFVHGFTTDFYSHAFYHHLTSALKNKSHASILIQTRGTGLHTEFLKSDGNGTFIGSYYEKLSDAHLDISAFIQFLNQQGHSNIILIGHSLGTIKAVRYLFEGQHRDKISKLILLAPFDKNVFMEIKAPGKLAEFLKVAKQKIALGQGREIVPVPQYEDYPMSYETFYSWYEPTDLNKVWDFHKPDYDFPILQQITIPLKAILGDQDEFVTYPQYNVSPHTALNTIKKYCPNSQTTIIPNANHTFFNLESQLATEIISFL